MSSGGQSLPAFGGSASSGLPSMNPLRGFGSPVVQALQKPAAPQGPQTQPPATQAPMAAPAQSATSTAPQQQPMQRPMLNDVQRQQMQQYRDYQQEQFSNWQSQQAPIYENTDIDVGITGSGGRRAAAPMSLQDMRGLWRNKGAWR
jgi:hypothetical protein